MNCFLVQAYSAVSSKKEQTCKTNKQTNRDPKDNMMSLQHPEGTMRSPEARVPTFWQLVREGLPRPHEAHRQQARRSRTQNAEAVVRVWRETLRLPSQYQPHRNAGKVKGVEGWRHLAGAQGIQVRRGRGPTGTQAQHEGCLHIKALAGASH